MSFGDLLKMSLSSLWRRKLRTVLTVLGVVVGTASIMVMISLGLGLSKSNMEQIEQYGGLTTITVAECITATAAWRRRRWKGELRAPAVMNPFASTTR